MAKPGGFLEYPRVDPRNRPVPVRLGDFREIPLPPDREELVRQASRCLDCGIPFCHGLGCPLANRVPDFNEMVYRGQWERGLRLLHSTNNFPEFTGRVCPAPCETACTLEPDFGPVVIRQIELELIERGWREGWVRDFPPTRSSGKRVAVIGSGPAGLAAAQELARRGHEVIVFERDGKAGGLLRYGIPDFKLEKWIIDRRLDQLRREGVNFETGVEAGIDLSARYLRRSFSAVLVAVGSRRPRELDLPGRDLEGVVLAMDYLSSENRLQGGEKSGREGVLDADGKPVVVLGGGDTGSDCVGTALRQGAAAVTQVEILPRPPETREASNPWPGPPRTLRTSSSQEEGCERLWAVSARELAGKAGRVEKVKAVRLDWMGSSGPREVPGSEFEIPARLVVIAAGFTGPESGRLADELNLDRNGGGGFTAAGPGIFSAGDCVRGASLVVNAIDEGRRAAAEIDAFLMG
ncbi:MAG: glutamate synthase subunit beta [Candidatus Erginobacter occultus]|nr:glutamate synthase subunit beta [Candidatus Erginobacter occultus]